MRVLFTTQPGIGHLHPLLPIADGMRRRGHQVAFASSASFAAEIEAAGFDAFPVGRDWLTVDMVRAFPEVISRPPGPERYAWARATVFAGHTAREAVPDLLALGGAGVPISSSARQPSTAGAWPPSSSTSRTPPCGPTPAARPTPSGTASATSLSELRASFGLPADPAVEMPFRYLQLSFAPTGLDEPDDEAAPTRHRFRPIELPPDGADETPPWLADLPRRATVYATLGTVYNGTDLLTAIIDALEGRTSTSS